MSENWSRSSSLRTTRETPFITDAQAIDLQIEELERTLSEHAPYGSTWTPERESPTPTPSPPPKPSWRFVILWGFLLLCSWAAVLGFMDIFRLIVQLLQRIG